MVSRSYHYITSYYNYYFNAYDSYKSGIARSENSFKYNFTLPLPVILIGDQQVTGMISGDMDRAITKATNLITKHSITVKPERKKGASAKEKQFYNQSEFVKWATQSWILIGKAQAWKGSYSEASQTLEFILLQFPNTTIWYEAQVWLARISIINKDFLNAADKLKSVEAARKRPVNRQFNNLLYSTWTYFYTQQNKYEEAIPYLRKALDNATTHKEKLRYTYLLAQLNQKYHHTEDAIALFSKILRMNPSYDLYFNARINLASLYQEGGRGKDMKKELLKLSRDDKNKEYLDQIYFELGNIEKAEGNMVKAIEYYKLSAQKSVENNNQKGISYLTLADYYFAKPDYTQSQAYYDSAMSAIDENYPDYQKLEIKTKYLTKLVENLNIIYREDSLQKVAKMSEQNRDNLITQLINKVREEEEKERMEETVDRDRSLQYQQNLQRYQQTQDQEGKWYFYNQASLSYGQSEFIMKWGRRKLEDNWRRKNKRITTVEIAAEDLQSSTDTSTLPQKLLSNTSKEYYLVDLPMNDSLINISNQRIVEAMFKVGEVYQNDLNDYNETVKSYERLIERFPDNLFTLQAYYNLYRSSVFVGNTSNSNKYKNIIVTKYPSSSYAQMLTNPDYLKELTNKLSEEDLFYQEVYVLYQAKNYSQAKIKAEEGLAKYSGSNLEPQFRYIKALCIGKTSDIRTFKSALTEVTEKHRNSEVSKAADNILEYLRKQELQMATIDTSKIAVIDTSLVTAKPSVAYLDPAKEQIYIAVIPKKSDINQLKFNLVSFNVDNFINLDLEVSNLPFNEFFELIKVEKFKDTKEAMEYYRTLSKQADIWGTLKPEEYSMFIISNENLTIFLTDKSIVDYLKFFRSTYK